VNDDGHSRFMALRIGYCYVYMGVGRRGKGEKSNVTNFYLSLEKNPSDAHVRIVCGTKRLNPFFRLHEASEVLNKYAMGVWPNNFTAAVFVSFIMAVFVPSIEGIQNKVIRL